MSKDKKDKEMICGLTADERDLLQSELRALPEVMPPRDVWQRIREQGEAEGLIRQNALRRPMSWNGGLGLAAGIGLVVGAAKPAKGIDQRRFQLIAQPLAG